MDGFTDSLSQRFADPQEMIAANSQADAEEMEDLRGRVDKYEDVLDKLNEKISEMQAPEIQIPQPTIDPEEYASQLTGVEDKLQQHIHKENVRVYRNVQAAVVDELAKQTETLNQSTEGLSDKLDALGGKYGRLEQKVDTLTTMVDDKLYELGKDINAARNSNKGKALFSMQVIILIVAIVDLAVNVLKLLGMI